MRGHPRTTTRPAPDIPTWTSSCLCASEGHSDVRGRRVRVLPYEVATARAYQWKKHVRCSPTVTTVQHCGIFSKMGDLMPKTNVGPERDLDLFCFSFPSLSFLIPPPPKSSPFSFPSLPAYLGMVFHERRAETVMGQLIYRSTGCDQFRTSPVMRLDAFITTQCDTHYLKDLPRLGELDVGRRVLGNKTTNWTGCLIYIVMRV